MWIPETRTRRARFRAAVSTDGGFGTVAIPRRIESVEVNERVGRSFSEWLACPTCDDGGDVKILAYATDVVLECYDCGAISEYVIGEDIPFAEITPEELGESETDARTE